MAVQIVIGLVAAGQIRTAFTTGVTPVSLYHELARRNAAGEVSFRNVEIVTIDEYYPSSRDEHQSRNYRLHEAFLDRIDILKEHGYKLKDVQDTIAKIDPMPGAREFLDELRTLTQVIIISDTFSQFAKPLMEKLGWPTLFCNELIVSDDDEITGIRMRCEQSKLTTVKALQSCGFDTIASGDSFNDIGMILASKAGFLFKSTEAIKAEYPDVPAFEEYDELLAAIKEVL